MYMQYVLLAPGAFLVAMLVAILAGGSLIGLGGLIVGAVRAMGRKQVVQVEAVPAKPAARPAVATRSEERRVGKECRL